MVITCAEDIPQGDKDAIIGGIFAMGGQYSAVLTKMVTHVVALTMDNPHCKLVVEKKLRCKAVLPHWFDDCLKLGKKINHSPYLLPNPPILSSNSTHPMKHTIPPEIAGASSLTVGSLPQISTPPASPSEERRQLDVFGNKRVLLHTDLNLSPRLNKSIMDLIASGGGIRAKDVYLCDMLICQFRESDEFRAASRAGKDVGNLVWLYHLINHNIWTSPTRRLLHYPIPQNGVPGFGAFKISISNYTGEARIYLESLVKAAGGIFTKSMMQENTHLITAHTFSEKCDAAKEWNINMVNHLWLEESYAKCQVQSVTNPRYTTFPLKTNLCEVIGQTQIDRDAVEKRHFPSSYKNSQASAGKLEPLEPNSSARAPGAMTSIGSPKNKDLKTPGPVASGKENETLSSRGAKSRALNKLHSMAPDIALFEKESKRVGGVIYGGRKATDSDRVTITNTPGNRKRNRDGDISNAPSEEPNAIDTEDTYPRTRKKQKKDVDASSTSTELSLKVLVTGYGGWTKQTNNGAGQKAKLKTLGINVVSSLPSDGSIDVLAAPKVLRTRNFLAGMSAGPIVVSTDWIEMMLDKDERLDPLDYELKDKDGEEKMGITLKEAIDRAKANKETGGMLKDWVVFCTEGLKGTWEAFEEIVRVNGGRCHLFKGRETIVARVNGRKMRNGGDEGEVRDKEETLHLITEPKDHGVWKKFCDMARKDRYEPTLVKADWMLRVAAGQDLSDWKDEWQFVEGLEGQTKADVADG